ncbi:MAG: trigger factor [Candidatus Saccharimonas sp.]
MKTSVKHLSDTRVLVTVTVDKDALATAEQAAVKKLAKTVKVAGFRKGHVPLEVAKKHIDPNLLIQESLDRALSWAVAKVFLDSDLQALERPQVEVKKFVPGQQLEFTAEADVLPKVTLGDYKKLTITKPKITVAKADIDDVIERIRAGFSEKKTVKKDAQSGDEVVIDFVGKKDDVAFDGGTATDYALTLGSNSFIPGFEDALIGKAAGDSLDIPLSFPNDYHSKDLAGAKVVFSVTVKKVNQVVLPEVTDEFAAKVGPFTSVDDLKKDIKTEITAQKNREADDKIKDDVVAQLVKVSKVAVPAVLRADQIRSIEQDLTQNLAYQGMTFDQYLAQKGFKNRDEWAEKEAATVADERIKAGLVLAELSKVFAVTITDDEKAEQLATYRAQYANNPDMVKQFDDPQVQRELANRLITEKTVNQLVALNTN